MPYTIERCGLFADSIRRAMNSFDPMLISMRISEFVLWKRAGGHGSGGPFTDDKWSGYRPDGTIFQPYVSGKVRHCHMDLSGTEPLIAYRQFDTEQRIVMLCITSHREMFHGNEPTFWRRYKAQNQGHIIP